MKSINKKLTLSALALACCLSAGVMSLQASATADFSTIDNTGFTMSNGASVYLGTDEEYSGIRWTTNVSTAFYEQLPSNAQFGVIVAPTAALNGQDLTHANAETLGVEVATIAQGSVNASETAQTYYSAIDFNDIVEQAGVTDEAEKESLLQQAYAMELTARAYVKVGEEYVYANLNGVNTSRSARQVAIAAELAGEIDKKYRGEGATAEDTERAAKGVAYYGKEDKYVPGEKSIGAAGTAYVNLEAPDTDVAVANFEFSGDIEEVLIGAERVSYTTYAENTLTIDEANFAPTGEHYVTVFTTTGEIYTKPIIGATKVLTTVDDLKMFNAKGDKGIYTTKTVDSGKAPGVDFVEEYWQPEQEQGGYYVLGQNIEADGYVHGSLNVEDTEKNITAGYNNATWNSPSAYKNKPIGLTGTFNGMGYTIKDMTIGTEREGFFGIVNGGTVKNVGFQNVKSGRLQNDGYGYRYVIANYLVDATIDSVYIDTNEYTSDDETNNPGFDVANSALLASLAVGDTTVSNCYFKFNTIRTQNDNVRQKLGGALFATTHSDESFTFNNVVVYYKDNYAIHKPYIIEATINDDQTVTYSKTTVNIALSAGLVKLATLPTVSDDGTTLTGDVEKGLIYLYENQQDSNPYSSIAEFYDFKVLEGVARYTTGTQIKNGYLAGYNNWDGFATSGCWTQHSNGYAQWTNL
ncbi:MAG: hypothetical protein IJA89_00980 [Clostridia bacterium]|nr:hypothetical protein [Clostridia bacterium]